MGTDNKEGSRIGVFKTENLLPVQTELMPVMPVQRDTLPQTRQLEQHQLQKEQVNTGDLQRRSGDKAPLPEITDDQAASRDRILNYITEPIPDAIRRDPFFIEALDRNFSVMRPVMMGGTEDEKSRSAAQAALIGAKREVYLQEQIQEHRADTRVALEKLNQARTEAEIDPVTGGLNRKGLERQVLQALMDDEEGVIVELDLNLLKLLNDQYGEPVGDRVLKETLEALTRGVRKSDVTGRWGGDEFLIILKGVNVEMTKKVLARQVDAQLEATKIPELEGRSISLGAGYIGYNPKDFQGLGPVELNDKIVDMFYSLNGALKTAKDQSKLDESDTHRAYVDAATPLAQERAARMKADKSVVVTFMR